MKTKILMYFAMLGIAYTASAAIDPVVPVKNLNSAPLSVVDAYITAHVQGNAALFDKVLDNDAVVKIITQNNVIRHTKEQLLKFYEHEKDLALNCNSSYEVLSGSDCVKMVRVDFKFPAFVQQNFLVLEKNKKGLWKITQINRFSQTISA